MRPAFDLSVYFITDPALCAPRGVAETTRLAVVGGASLVQLRDPAATTRKLVEEARALVALLRPRGVKLIVNDRVDVALAAGADGVHVGQSDMAAADARGLIGPDRILGLSITALADLERSDLAPVDYLGVGPIFATGTKADAAPPMGLAGLAAVRARTGMPIVAIGGIGTANAADVIRAGADGVAVVSAIAGAVDPQAAAATLAVSVARAKSRAGPAT
jgi:thiamine-phosphate pyrophosphorylase